MTNLVCEPAVPGEVRDGEVVFVGDEVPVRIAASVYL